MRSGLGVPIQMAKACALGIACLFAIGVLTGCPLRPPAELTDGTVLTSQLKVNGEVVFRRNSTVHNINPAKNGEDLFVILQQEPDIDVYGMASNSAPITETELHTFVNSTWSGGTEESFYQALLEFDCGPEELIHIIETSGMPPLETIQMLETVDAAFPDSAAGSEVVGLYDWLQEEGKTLADFKTAILNTGLDVQAYMARLSNLGMDVYTLRDVYEAIVELQPDEEDPLQFLVNLLAFNDQKQSFKDFVEIGKFAYDVIKNSHGVTTADDVTEIVHGDDQYWGNYTKGTLSDGSVEWQVYEYNPFGADWLVVDVTYKIIVYYDKQHATLPGQYLSAAVIADSVWVGAVSSVNASAAVTAPTQIGTLENPVPQAFGKVKMASKYLAIPEASDAFSFTVYGDAPWEWGNVPH